MIRTRSLTFAALLIAAGIAASYIFHVTGIGGQIALPLHYPPLLAGLMLGWRWGFAVGSVIPILSALLTGMPPLIPSALLMVPELAVYGTTAGLIRKTFGLYGALITSLILGRLTWGGAVWLLAPLLGLKIPIVGAITSALIIGLPGIIGQFIIVPMLVLRLEKSDLLYRSG